MGVLDGKAAIVTGSARGIGRATAELLSAEGARVLINDLDGDLAELAAAEIDGETAVFAGDLTADGAPEALVGAAIAAFGQLDIVVNNAGYTWDGIAHRMSDEQFRAMLEIHTVVPFKVIRAASPYLRDAGKQERAEGREVFRKVVNVTSISGTQGNVGQVNYAAGKAGLIGVTKSLAREWGRVQGQRERRRIRVRRDTAYGLRGGGRDDRARRARDLARNSGRDEKPRVHDHPARTRDDTRGGRRPDLLSLLPVVELRPRPGVDGERRSDDRDDVSLIRARARGSSWRSRRRSPRYRHDAGACVDAAGGDPLETARLK